MSAGVVRELKVRQPSRSNTSLAGVTTEATVAAELVAVDIIQAPSSVLDFFVVDSL
jgi:hypothetical protein